MITVGGSAAASLISGQQPSLTLAAASCLLTCLLRVCGSVGVCVCVCTCSAAESAVCPHAVPEHSVSCSRRAIGVVARPTSAPLDARSWCAACPRHFSPSLSAPLTPPLPESKSQFNVRLTFRRAFHCSRLSLSSPFFFFSANLRLKSRGPIAIDFFACKSAPLTEKAGLCKRKR